MRLRKKRQRQAERLRLFFASDIHASERCWRKFLAAADAYRVDLLVMGGDVTGKAVIPLVANGSGYVTTAGGMTQRVESASDRARLERRLQDQGYYTAVLEREEVPKENTREYDDLYRRLALETVERWLALAEEKLAGKGCRLLFLPGNDDLWDIDPLIAESSVAENPEGKALDLGEGYGIISTGFANPTPWNTPRELPEDELERMLERISAGARFKRLLLLAHVPPFNSTLDLAPKVNKVETSDEVVHDLSFGQPQLVPVGSTAVRRFIELHRPLVGLHGHVHEARGIARVGATTCINPGSEFRSGDIGGAILELRGSSVHQCQLINA